MVVNEAVMNGVEVGADELWLGSEMTSLTETSVVGYSGTSGSSDRDTQEGGWLVAGREERHLHVES